MVELAAKHSIRGLAFEKPMALQSEANRIAELFRDGGQAGLGAGSKLWDIDHRFKACISLVKTVAVPHAHIPWDEQ